MSRQLGQATVTLQGRDLVNRSPDHVRGVKVLAERRQRIVNDVVFNRVAQGNLCLRFRPPLLGAGNTGLVEKTVQQLGVLAFFSVPAIHELLDDRISAGGRAHNP